MADELAIEAFGLKKRYGSVPVLAGVQLSVPRACCLALLGRNGAGKTTTVRILSTLIRPDGGRARVAGWDVVRDRHLVRSRISLTGQYAALDQMQTGEENLRMVARLAGLGRAGARRRAAELLERFELGEAARRRVATYSGGMRRRLDLAASLTGTASVIILDEPTTGLDLPSSLTAWQVISELRDRGVTVLLTTQNLEEADRLADRIAVLEGGRVVAEGPPAELKKQVAEQRLELTLADRPGFDAVTGMVGSQLLNADPSRLTVSLATDGTAAGVRQLLNQLDPDGAAIRRFSMRSATLDEVFLALTGTGRVIHRQESIHV